MIQVLNKGLDFTLILNPSYKKIQSSEDFYDKPAFCPKSNWKPRPAHPGLNLFLSQLEKEIFNGL